MKLWFQVQEHWAFSHHHVICEVLLFLIMTQATKPPKFLCSRQRSPPVCIKNQFGANCPLKGEDETLEKQYVSESNTITAADPLVCLCTGLRFGNQYIKNWIKNCIPDCECTLLFTVSEVFYFFPHVSSPGFLFYFVITHPVSVPGICLIVSPARVSYHPPWMLHTFPLCVLSSCWFVDAHSSCYNMSFTLTAILLLDLNLTCFMTFASSDCHVLTSAWIKLFFSGQQQSVSCIWVLPSLYYDPDKGCLTLNFKPLFTIKRP